MLSTLRTQYIYNSEKLRNNQMHKKCRRQSFYMIMDCFNTFTGSFVTHIMSTASFHIMLLMLILVNCQISSLTRLLQ